MNPSEPLRRQLSGSSPTLLERAGLRSVTAGSASWPPPTDPIEVLTPEEQSALARIEWWAVACAAVAGALSAAACALAAIYAPAMEHHPVQHWALVLSAMALATLVEITYLYWLSLRAVREMAKAAGLRVHTSSELDEAVALSLARAALELPSPPHNLLEVDPHREASRLGLIAASLLYKAKIALTNFVLKALVRSVLGRTVTRAMLEWVALPVTALWNGLVMYQVLQEARLRVMGPSAAVLLAEWILAHPTDAGPVSSKPTPKHKLVLQAVGTSIVANREAHPNVVALSRRLAHGAQLSREVDWGGRAGFLHDLRQASEEDRLAALRTLIAVAILDGKVTRREQRWLERCFESVGRVTPNTLTKELRRRFVHGEGLPSEVLPKEF